ncbi:MAG: amidohydrolase family protein [Oscillospiraceae bacterium]|jgi:imidazolonepropionase-like amidohydrolase|nr:amidohydrolase family protein [Oscillospiraceae bacterium]
MIVYDAKIFTADGEDRVFGKGFIEIENGVIKKIGDMSVCPAVAGSDYNAKGGAVYPGFVDAHCHLGVWENASGFEGDDGNETTDPCTPHLRAIDMVNPSDLCFGEAAKAGVTTVAVGPGSANAVSGSFLIMKTLGRSEYERIDDRIIKSPSAIKFALGENPKRVYCDRDEAPVTRMATAAIIREQLYKAKRYLETVTEHEKTKGADNETGLPDFDIKCEALIPLLKGEVKMHAHCHRCDDIFTAIRLAKEFGLELVVIHGTDSFKIAGELKKDGVFVILGPVISDRGKPELAGHSITAAAALEKHGVKFAICTDHPVLPAQYLPLSAGLAIRGGLSEEKALRAITADAARICGVAASVGSIEEGKDADLAIFNGGAKFYEVLAKPEAVFIGGARVL